VSGALAERVFVDKIERLGFERLEVPERRPFGIDDVGRYPLFTPDLLATMRRLIPGDQQSEVATAVTITAIRP
jgi:arsenite methyltransferase